MKKLIKTIKDWRDRRFRERIDRVYFRHSGDGMRYIDGYLMAVFDSKTGRGGNLGCSSEHDYKTASASVKIPRSMLGVNAKKPLSK